jgi:hypothetical protein
MTLKDFAKKLDGREYGYPQFTEAEIQEAKDHNFVIVFGASDDLIELDGAIYDENDVWDGGETHILLHDTEEEFKGFTENSGEDIIDVRAKWCEDWDKNHCHILWTYETNVPHETFDIMEDGQIYCRGFVFEIK